MYKLKQKEKIIITTVQLLSCIITQLFLYNQCKIKSGSLTKTELEQLISRTHKANQKIQDLDIVSLQKEVIYNNYTFNTNGVEHNVTFGVQPKVDKNGHKIDGDVINFVADGYIDGYIASEEGSAKMQEITSKYWTAELSLEDRLVTVTDLNEFKSLCKELGKEFKRYMPIGDYDNYIINCNFLVIYDADKTDDISNLIIYLDELVYGDINYNNLQIYKPNS